MTTGETRYDMKRTRLEPVSAKRRVQSAERARVRVEVLARDGGCRAAELPQVPCGWIPDRAPLEVHEVIPRGRGGDWLDVDNCVSLCPQSHDWVTEHPREATELGLLASGFGPPEDPS